MAIELSQASDTSTSPTFDTSSPSILFICSTNTARSLMAESLSKSRNLNAQSCGLKITPKTKIKAAAEYVLRENYNILTTSKPRCVDTLSTEEKFDYIVAMCDCCECTSPCSDELVDSSSSHCTRPNFDRRLTSRLREGVGTERILNWNIDPPSTIKAKYDGNGGDGNGDGGSGNEKREKAADDKSSTSGLDDDLIESFRTCAETIDCKITEFMKDELKILDYTAKDQM